MTIFLTQSDRTLDQLTAYGDSHNNAMANMSLPHHAAAEPAMTVDQATELAFRSYV